MLLKVGSRGQLVKDVQEFLEIGADGIFGKGTAEAVKEFQKANGLGADGLVGTSTWDVMGLATTDDSEKTFETENGLIVNRHYLPQGEYKVGPTSKEYVFLHHTAGWHNPFNCIDQWGRDSRGAVATEFVLGGPSVKGNNEDHDGVMVQAFPEGGYGWHLGKNGSQHMHTHSVGIEVCNFGWIKDGKTYAGTRVHESQLVELDKPFRGFKTWHKYSDDQIEALRKWILWIGERDGIDIRKGLPTLVKEKGADAFEFNQEVLEGKHKGLWTHTNVRKTKVDMFPQPELMDMLVSL